MRRKWAFGCLLVWGVLFHNWFLRVVTWRGGSWAVWGLTVPAREVWALLGVGTFAALLLAYTVTGLLLGNERRRRRLRPSWALLFYLALGTLFIETAVLLRLPSLQAALSGLRLDFAGRVLYEVGLLLSFVPIFVALFPIRPLEVPPGSHGPGPWNTFWAYCREAFKHGRGITDS